jgi:hypothetical protein
MTDGRVLTVEAFRLAHSERNPEVVVVGGIENFYPQLSYTTTNLV